jgi:hypothetical protein
MMSSFILIFLAITQIGGIGMNVHSKTFPTLTLCNRYAESEFLSNKDHWIHKSKTYNFYNSQYEMNIKDSVNGDMRVYYSCVQKKQECGVFWPCDENGE